MTAWTLLALLGAATIIIAAFHAYRYLVGLRKIRNELAHFHYVQEYDAYMDAQPEFYIAQPKRPYGVLLLHGFSVSAQAFSTLFEPLKQAEINFYAVTLTGYGMRSPHLIENVRYTDWLRDAIDAYDLLAKTVDKVHVVGSSLGCALSLILSRYRPVNKMILLGPALYLEPELNWLVRLGDLPIIRTIGWWFYPFYTKKLCVDQTGKSGKLALCSIASLLRTFHYSTFPISVAPAVDQTLRHVDLKFARFKKLYIFYGEKDEVVDINSLFTLLKKNHIDYVSKCYENSSHMLALDYDSDQVVKDVIHALQEDLHTEQTESTKIS